MASRQDQGVDKLYMKVLVIVRYVSLFLCRDSAGTDTKRRLTEGLVHPDDRFSLGML